MNAIGSPTDSTGKSHPRRVLACSLPRTGIAKHGATAGDADSPLVTCIHLAARNALRGTRRARDKKANEDLEHARMPDRVLFARQAVALAERQQAFPRNPRWKREIFALLASGWNRDISCTLRYVFSSSRYFKNTTQDATVRWTLQNRPLYVPSGTSRR